MANAQQHKHANTIAQIHNSQCWCQNYTSPFQIFRKSEDDENIWTKKRKEKRKNDNNLIFPSSFRLLYSSYIYIYTQLQAWRVIAKSNPSRERCAAGWPLAMSPNRDCGSDWEPSAEDFAILSRLSFSNCSAASSSCMLLSASISCWFRCVVWVWWWRMSPPWRL